ncbi:MAG: hypothetical protein V4550_18695 [Gemmatimonadota bacterium]
MRTRLLMTAFALAVGCTQADRKTRTSDSSQMAAVRACGGDSSLLDGDHAGALRLGMPLDSAMALCPSARDTVTLDEGERVRVLSNSDRGDTLVVRIVSDRIHSIIVRSRRFHTNDSLRAGTPVARLLSIPALTGGAGEGAFYVWSDDKSVCGMSFRLDDRTADAMFRIRHVTRRTLEPFAGAGYVTAILVRGCPPTR